MLHASKKDFSKSSKYLISFSLGKTFYSWTDFPEEELHCQVWWMQGLYSGFPRGMKVSAPAAHCFGHSVENNTFYLLQRKNHNNALCVVCVPMAVGNNGMRTSPPKYDMYLLGQAFNHHNHTCLSWDLKEVS